MKVLIACEFSGTIREVFSLMGHDAWSCDLLPTEVDGYGSHVEAPVEGILHHGWDLMIAHPPCTYLAVSGARWFAERSIEQTLALDFVRLLMDAPIERICIENPVSVISTRIRKPDQIIQPWEFGHPETKATCLWLKNLSKLVPTDIKDVRSSKTILNKGSGKNAETRQKRQRDRGRTYLGVALAMGLQWGSYHGS